MVSWLLTLMLMGASEAPALKPGYIVIADGATSRPAAEAKLKKYKKRSLPSHGDYPKLLASSDVQGLKPGFFIVVVGVARDEAVAKELAAFINASSPGAYVRRVEVPEPEDLRLLVIPRVDVSRSEEEVKPHELTWRLYQGLNPVSESSNRAEVLGLSRPLQDGRMVLPFTVLPHGKPEFFLSPDADDPDLYCQGHGEEDLGRIAEASSAPIIQVEQVKAGCRIPGD